MKNTFGPIGPSHQAKVDCTAFESHVWKQKADKGAEMLLVWQGAITNLLEHAPRQMEESKLLSHSYKVYDHFVGMPLLEQKQFSALLCCMVLD